MDEFEVFDVKPFVSRLLGDFSVKSDLVHVSCRNGSCSLSRLSFI